MQPSSIPLVVAAIAFLALVLWRVRPLGWSRRRRAQREELVRARLRIESATDDHTRALALCDAADITARTIAGTESATALYSRAMRTDFNSADIVQRAVAGLATRPRALESLLWRRLGATPWTGPPSEAVCAALDALSGLYRGRLKNAARARALEHARDAILLARRPEDLG
jgi:hypothetical protein